MNLIIKEQNVVSYLLQMLYTKPSSDHSRSGFDVNPYYLLKDEMYFKRDCGVNDDDTIEFELTEFTQQSRSYLSNKYTYKVSYFDSVSLLLTLIDFKVEFKNRVTDQKL